MIWTTRKPKKVGWYWVKANDLDARVLWFDVGDDLQSHPIQPDSGPRSTEGWDEFAGPIKAPKFAPPKTTPK